MEGDLQRQLGRTLRRLREQAGYSQEGFADVIGVHRTYMGGIERGERNLTLKSVERIAGWLGVEALDLINDAPDLKVAPKTTNKAPAKAGRAAR